MTIILLDTGVAGQLVAPQPPVELQDWLVGVISRGRHVFLPEIVDYELRREFLRALPSRVPVLDALPERGCEYLPITTAAMHQAAAFWARLRHEARPTAHNHALDADCILAGQAFEAAASERRPVRVATLNVRHLARLVDAALWTDIS